MNITICYTPAIFTYNTANVLADLITQIFPQTSPIETSIATYSSFAVNVIQNMAQSVQSAVVNGFYHNCI